MSFFKRKAPTIYPTHLVVGLGNPGAEYRGTRHNVGFEVIDRLSKQLDIPVKTGKHQAQIGIGHAGAIPIALVKPLTYMNLSGRSVAPIASQYGIAPENILVIADDLDLRLGHVRMRAKGSSGGHNGHKSLIAALKTTEYPRLKIGIGRGGETIDHVLNRFNPEERVVIDQAVEIAARAVVQWLDEGIDAAMASANRAGKELNE